MAAIEWEKLKGHAGLQYRAYGEEGMTWRCRQMVEGSAIQDYLGLMSAEQAIETAARLRHNRKTGAGPQSFKEMEDEAREVARVGQIREETERRRAIEADEFTRSNTIATFWDHIYWPKRSKKGSAHGRKSMEGVYNNWIKPVIGDVPLMEFSYLHVEKMLSNMREVKITAHGRRRKNGLAAKTQMHAYTILQGLWNEARIYHSATRKLELPIFPGKLIDKQAPNNEKTCWLEMDEARVLLKTLKGWRECCKRHGINCKGPDTEDAYGMAVLSLFSGLRLGDICKLTWGEVIDKEMAYARNPKGGKSYGIHLDVPEIRKMLAERRAKLPATPRPDDLVFRNFQGKQWKSAPQIFDDAVEEIGLNYTPRRWKTPEEKIDFHALRHTFGSWLAMRGESLYTIMELMGHKSLKMTQRYARLDPSKTRQSVEDMYADYKDLEKGEGEEKKD
jgi:integrase